MSHLEGISDLKEENIINLLKDLKIVEEKLFLQILENKDVFLNKLNEEKRKLPYNINLLDEIHANENAHSRILVKLLQYRHDKEFPILRSFLNFLEPPFSTLSITNPEITAENNRIDVRIRERNYSIIIENKIMGAKDRDQQIERYVTNEKDQYQEANIFILYLTLAGGSPNELSLTRKRRREFSIRYKEINYREHILPWIRGKILPLIQSKENEYILQKQMLSSAVFQYINFLEGKFNQRKGEIEMNNAMINMITEKLLLDEPISDVDKIYRVKDYQDYAERLVQYLKEKESYLIRSFLKKVSETILNMTIEGISKIKSSGEFGKKDSELQFMPNGWNEKYLICVGFGQDLAGLFYGIKDESPIDPDASDNPLIDTLKKVLGPGDPPYNIWLNSDWISEGADSEALIQQMNNNELMKIIVGKVIEILKRTKHINFS
jgi:hypothetical protein